MDELQMEPLELLENAKESQVETFGTIRWNAWKCFLPAGIIVIVFFTVGIYLLIVPTTDKLVAQVFRYDIIHTPDTARVVLSISNKQETQAVIVQLYPVFFGKKYSGIYARSIEGSTIEGISLPLVLNPGEVRTLDIKYSIEKRELDQYADKLKDSSHIVVFKNGPPPGQLEGNLGLGWRVVDADGKNYSSIARLAYYVLTPTSPGFGDPTTLTRSWTLSDDPFELCTMEEVVPERN